MRTWPTKSRSLPRFIGNPFWLNPDRVFSRLRMRLRLMGVIPDMRQSGDPEPWHPAREASQKMLISAPWAPGQQQQLFLLLDAQLHRQEMVIPGGPARESAQIASGNSCSRQGSSASTL